MADYRTRLTADTSQHDQAISKSAQSVYKYKKGVDSAKVTLGGLAKKFGPLAAQIGIAGGALATFKKIMTSTEQGADAFDSAIYTAKSSVERFFQSISAGSFNAFTDGLKEITKAAREAYNALDDLGTMKMWNNADIEKQRTIIAKNRTILYDRNATAEQKKAAQQAIDNAIKEIERLNGQLVKQSEKVSTALLREYAGTTRVSTAQLEKYRKMLKEGTLAQHAEDFKKKNSYETYDYVTMDANAPASKMYYTKWNDKNAELLYSVMQSYLTLPEGKWQQLLDIENQNEQRMQQIEQMKQQSERTAGRVEKGNDSKNPKLKVETELEPLPKGSIADLEQQLSKLKKDFSLATTDEQRAELNKQIEALQSEIDRMSGKEVKIEPVIPDGSIAALEKQLDDLKDKFKLATTDEDRTAIQESINSIQTELDKLTINPAVNEGSIAWVQEQIKDLTDQLENTPDAELRIKLLADIEGFQEQLKELNTSEAERAAEALKLKYEQLQTQTEATASAFSSIGSIFTSLGSCFGEEGEKIMQVIGTVMEGIGTAIPKILSLTAAQEGEALASGTASAAKLPYPANLAAIASVVATIMGVIGSIASVAKFADGGIFQGGTTIGDYNLARVNSGEMILNNRQQTHLFRLLNNPTISTTSTDGGNVTFTIHGSDLQGTLVNYNKRVSRVR